DLVSIACEQIGCRRAADLFLVHVGTVVQVIRSRAVDRPAHASAEAIVLETRTHRTGYSNQLISRIPGVSVDAVIGEISAGIIAECRGSFLGEPVCRVVCCTAQRLWQTSAS